METGTLLVPAGTYRLDAMHSTVGFAVLHKVSRFRGTFESFDAALTVDDNGTMALTGSASVPSLRVRQPDMAAHLQSPDFFDAERYPSVAFRSTSIDIGVHGGTRVIGELTIRDRTRIVVAEGTLMIVADDGHGHRLVGLDLETTIDRRDFGITFTQQLPGGGGSTVASAVTIGVELELSAD